MLEFPNFTLKGTYYTGVFIFDESEFKFHVELTPTGESNVSFAVADNTYVLREMGKELIAMAEKADRLIRCARELKEEAYEVI